MSEWLPSLNALRAFEAVSRHLSFRKAADELHVTPAAVKQLVRNLEKALGRALVRRQGRGLVLTEVGTAGLAELRQAFESLAASVARMRRLDERRLFTITVEPAFAAAWLVRRLQG
jgi:LysR family glycine cleavage system transcriptional activator